MIETCSRKKLRSLRHDSTSALLNPNAATTATAKSGDNRKRQRTEEDKDIYSDSSIGCLLSSVPLVAERFNVLEMIGRGTFSHVYKSHVTGNVRKLYALKHVVPTSSPRRISNELKCLNLLKGRENIIAIETCLRWKDNVVIVLPFVSHQNFKDYVGDMSVSEMRDYVRGLFIALRGVHSMSIIHRDIKPSNFLYNRQTKEFRLIDFGLAHLPPASEASVGDFVDEDITTTCGPSVPTTVRRSTRLVSPSSSKSKQTGCVSLSTRTSSLHSSLKDGPSKHNRHASDRKRIRQRSAFSAIPFVSCHSKLELRLCPTRHKLNEVCNVCCSRPSQETPRDGTPGFRAPEVLMKSPDQSAAVDVWSAGVTMLCILSSCYPFFKAQNDMEALAQIVTVFGSHQCVNAARIIHKDLVCSPEVTGWDLKGLCRLLRYGKDPTPSCECGKGLGEKRECWRCLSDAAYEFLTRCLDLNPFTRFTAEQALAHPFLLD